MLPLTLLLSLLSKSFYSALLVRYNTQNAFLSNCRTDYDTKIQMNQQHHSNHNILLTVEARITLKYTLLKQMLWSTKMAWGGGGGGGNFNLCNLSIIWKCLSKELFLRSAVEWICIAIIIMVSFSFIRVYTAQILSISYTDMSFYVFHEKFCINNNNNWFLYSVFLVWDTTQSALQCIITPVTGFNINPALIVHLLNPLGGILARC